MRLVYADFEHYAGDAEWLVTRAAAEAGKAFDYVEGFALVNADDPVNGWGSVPLEPGQRLDGEAVPPAAGPVLYCLELAAYYDLRDGDDSVDKVGRGHFGHSVWGSLSEAGPTTRTSATCVILRSIL